MLQIDQLEENRSKTANPLQATRKGLEGSNDGPHPTAHVATEDTEQTEPFHSPCSLLPARKRRCRSTGGGGGENIQAVGLGWLCALRELCGKQLGRVGPLLTTDRT